MNKKEFMGILKTQLTKLPENERDDILYDYEEHFNIGLNEGREESEIATSLGNPKLIAKEINANYLITKAESKITVHSTFSALLAFLGLGFFNLVFVLGPFVGIAATLFSLIVSGLAIVVSGIALIVAPFIDQLNPDVMNYLAVHPLVFVFTGIGLIAFGVLWVIGFIYLNKLFYQGTLKYLKMNLNIIISRRGKNE